ncbi:hypothetical protein RJT34_19165 [Clitoria ternatea]|uniref:Uncharacterized protein n=1 Tax=Clitoria ternatea TaxID=43366 RepID=A0AAN9P487_CLITE
MELQSPFFDDIDSTCSTPYVSAPSSPGRGPFSAAGFFYSAPASPMHFAITAAPSTHPSSFDNPSSHDFEFSARFTSTGPASSGSMTSADELFFNGQIRPMKLSTHLQGPQVLSPLIDLEEEEDEEIKVESHVRGRDLRLRDNSLRRRTRSLSPLRNTPSEWTENDEKIEKKENEEEEGETITSASVSGSSSSSSSSGGRSSKRWVFLRDFLRSKSEGRSNNKFWSTISFSPTKEKKVGNRNHGDGASETRKSKGNSQAFSKNVTAAGKPTNGVGKRRVPPSAHELHYKANRAQAEELRKKTFLPYRQGLFGCLGFSSKGYGAMSGFARALNPVSSR